jgi:outer membrane protein insertion porin family
MNSQFFKNVFFLFFTVLAANSFGQTDSLEAKTYEIGGIAVKGNEFVNENAIINLSGLSVGKSIKIPSDDVRDVIKKIWKLRMFEDVRLEEARRIGSVIFLEIHVKERPRLSSHFYEGAPKNTHEDLNKVLDKILVKGSIMTENTKAFAASRIINFFRDKGYLLTTVDVLEEPDTLSVNATRIGFKIDRQERIKIREIVINGNEKLTDKKIKKLFKETKEKKLISFKKSKFISKDFEDDKDKLIKHYNTIGLRDAHIKRDTQYIIYEDGKPFAKVELDIHEGKEYRFGNIVFKGNSVYEEVLLARMLGISKGDVYNNELLTSRLRQDAQGRDLSTLYMDNGYLFFNVVPSETGIHNDSIDIEIRISEGPQATIDKIIIKGNERTHEHVIRRELRTKPGQKFSKTDLIRSHRELAALNYFNPESININPVPNPQKGTVDIEYTVEERPADQLELSAGWGGFGGGIVGTLGVSFNNFSLRNISNPASWSPMPQGDGQRLSMRVQTNGRFYQAYNFSFYEPWLGGKKPNSFSVSASLIRNNNGYTSESSSYQNLGIFSASVGLGTRLKWPDDFFVSQTSLIYQNYDLAKYGSMFTYRKNGISNPLPDGSYNAFAIEQTFSRNSILDPTFPREGSKISLTMKIAPPLSFLRNFDASNAAQAYQWVEYHKWNIKADWFHPVGGKLVFRAAAKLGYLGYFNNKVGYSPFEQYSLGGNGLNTQVGFQGLEILSARGYDVSDYMGSASIRSAPLYNKFTFELRYPISLNPSSTIYALTFFEAANAWQSFGDYNPFKLKRSFGAGLRVFLPMFGILGFDYGFGIDKIGDKTLPSGGVNTLWESGTFNLILGFEPE